MKFACSLKKFIPFTFLIVCLILFFSFKLYHYLSFNAIKQNSDFMLAIRQQYYWLSVLYFMSIYIIIVSISIPGAAILSILGGYLFGIFPGIIYIIVSETIGATIIFLATRYAFADLIANNAGKFVQKLENGFHENEFSYILVLRLIPLFPFFLVNLVSGLLNARARIYIIATFIGIIPGCIVYASVGNGLGALFNSDQTPNLGVIFTPAILLPMLGLAVLALLPAIYKQLTKESKESGSGT